MKQYIAILLALFCLTATAFSQNVEVKVYKVHPNYDGLFDEESIMIPAQAKIMMKSPSKVEGAMTLKELYDAGWRIVLVYDDTGGSGFGKSSNNSKFIMEKRKDN